MADGARHPWAVLPAEELLAVRLCDLDLHIRGTWLESCIDRLHADLDRRGLRIRPTCWLAEEWFCPQGICGIAIPFYLAHPRLMRLEYRQAHAVEGGTRRECLQLLRHEMGHAIQGALGLHRRRRWWELFGRSSRPYPDQYRPSPTSRRFVQHLGYWYAQSHPLEDFAESFAVWLDPRSAWRRRYEGWPALEKLVYIDEVMAELAGKRPGRLERTRIEEIRTIRKTIGEYYEERFDRYGDTFPAHFDDGLRRVFRAEGAGEPAAIYLRRHRRRLRRRVLSLYPDDAYAIDLVLRELIGRSRTLGLVAPEEESLFEDSTLLTAVATTRRLHDLREWYKM
jgi:hypothetical protein